MAQHQMKMPDIGEGVVDAEVVAWHVKVGDLVKEDQHFVDVMTDKATVEMSSPVAGTVLELRAEPGERIAVGAPLIVFETGESGSAASPLPPAGEGGRRPGEGEAPAKTPSPPPLSRERERGEDAPAPAPSPLPLAGEGGRRPGEGAIEIPAPEPVTRAEAESVASVRAAASVAHRPVAAPAVRRRAREAHVMLEDVPATGRGGRVTHADLEGFIAAGGVRRPAAQKAPASQRAPSPPPLSRTRERGAESPLPRAGEGGRRPGEGAAVTTTKLIGLRRVIAEKMALSKRRIPHYAFVEEVDITDLETLRTHLNEQRREDQPKLTYLPFIVRALVKALRDFPQCNAHFDDEAGQLTQYAAVHAGIAAQTPNGLMVPVIRDADTLDLWQIALEIQRLSGAARTGKAGRDELSGSTITITSLGKLGGIASTPVINHPEVAILGINKSELRPVVRNGAIVARLMMNLSASFDHRIVDGHDGASLVQALKGLLEFPATIFI